MIDEHKIDQLMILEAVGNISPEDSAELLKIMNYRRDFPFNELGEFQNLAALLALTAEEAMPSKKVKQRLLKLIKNNNGEEITIDEKPDELEVMEDVAELERLQSVKEIKSHPESISFKEPDLNELKIFSHPEDFEEVKSRASVIREKQNENTDSDKPSRIREFRAADYFKESSKKERKPVSRNTLLVLSIFIIAIIGIGFVYLVSSGDDKDVIDPLTEEHKELLVSKGDPDFEKPTSTTLAENVGDVDQDNNLITEPGLTEEEVYDYPLVGEELGKTDTVGMEKISGIEPPVMIVTPLTDPNENENRKIGSDEKLTSLDGISPPPREQVELQNEPTYFVAVEEMPEPIGGLRAIQEKIIYPEIARRAGVEGKVYVLAFIDESGTVTKAEVTKGIGMGCDEAAIDAVLKTKFKPGMQRGKPIKVQVTVPITFKHK